MKKILLLLFFTLPIFGQEEYYERVIGEDGDFANFSAVTVTPDGGYALLGSQNDGANLRQIYLVKTDAEGSEQWSQTYGDFNIQDGGLATFITEDDQLLMVGSRTGIASDETEEVFFKKIDLSNGNELWNKTTDLLIPDFDIEATYDGSAFFLEEPLDSAGYYAGNRIHLFDLNGEKMSDFEVERLGYSLKATPNGNFVTAFLSNDGNGNDFILFREYNTNGNIVSDNELDAPWAINNEGAPWLEGFPGQFIVDIEYDNQGNFIILVNYYFDPILIVASYDDNYQNNWFIQTDSIYYDRNYNRRYLNYDDINDKVIAIANDQNRERAVCLQIQNDGTLQTSTLIEFGDNGKIIDFTANSNGEVIAIGYQNEAAGRNSKGIQLNINENGTENFRRFYGIDDFIKSAGGSGLHYLGNEEFLVLKTENINGELNAKVVKIDRAGFPIEEQLIDLNGSFPRGIESSNDGNFLTTYFNSGHKLTKFTESGDILWETDLYNSPSFQKPLQFLVKESDGYSYAFANFNNTSLVHFIKLSEEGNVTDSTVVEVDFQITEIDGMYKKSNNNYALYGKSSFNSQEVTFLEFDEAKNLIRNSTHSSENFSYFARRQFLEGPNGTNNILGWKEYFSNIDGVITDYYTFYILQFDENGNFIQEIEDTTSKGNSTFYEAIPLKDDSGMLIIGLAASTSPYSDGETHLTKINWDGEIEWTQLISHTLGFNSVLYDFTEADDYFAFTGDVNKNNTRKIYYVHTDESIIGVNDLPFQNATIQLFPNPTQDKINIVFENEQVVKGNITITNAMGQTLKTINAPIFPNATLEIPVQDLADGIYILNIQNGKEVIAKQFVVQR